MPLRTFILFLLSLLAMPLPSLVAQVFFAPHTLEMKDRVRQVHTTCLRQDRWKELVVVERTGSYPDYGVRLTLYGLRQEETNLYFDKVRVFVYSSQEQPIAFDIVGECTQSGQQALVFFFKTKIMQHFYGSGRTTGGGTGATGQQAPFQIIPLDKPFAFTAQPGYLPYLHLTQDFDGDGSKDLIYPAMNQEDVMTLHFISNLFAPKATTVDLNLPLRHFLRTPAINQPLGFRYAARGISWIPEISSCDYNGDGKQDLCLSWQDEITILEQRADGSFKRDSSNKPLVRQLGVMTEKDRAEPGSYAITMLKPISDDAYTDIVVNRLVGSVAALNTLNRVIIRRAEGEQVYDIASPGGKASGALLIDVNGNGRPDVVTASVQTGLWGIVRALINRSVDVRFHFHLSGADGSFTDKPDFKRDISFKFNLRGLTPRGFLPSLQGDFNGDGLPDALYGRDSDRLEVILQKPQEFFPQSGRFRQKVQVSEWFLIDDLNGDGLDDLIFWYRDWDWHLKVQVLVNLNRWSKEAAGF